MGGFCFKWLMWIEQHNAQEGSVFYLFEEAAKYGEEIRPKLDFLPEDYSANFKLLKR